MIDPLFSALDYVDEPRAIDFLNSLHESFAQTEKSLSSYHRVVDHDFLHNRVKLEPLVCKFHSEEGTFSNNIKNQCALLNDPTTELLVSTYQPNLFAYSGVIKKIVLLETLKTTIEKEDRYARIINLFIVIDHDFIDEVWMRRAQLPSFHHSSGLLQLRLSVIPTDKWEVVCNIPRPRETILSNWKRAIISWIKKSTLSPSHRAEMVNNLNRFWELAQVAYSKAISYSDFNSFMMSRIVWGYNTLFVRLSEISHIFQNGFEFLISNHRTYTDVLRRTEQELLSQGIHTGVSFNSCEIAPMWLHCGCGSKAPVTIIRVPAEEKLALKGSCVSCNRSKESRS